MHIWKLLAVHQGSVLSQLSFNIVISFLTSELMQELLLSVRLAGVVGLASEKAAQLQKVFDKVNIMTFKSQ